MLRYRDCASMATLVCVTRVNEQPNGSHRHVAQALHEWLRPRKRLAAGKPRPSLPIPSGGGGGDLCDIEVPSDKRFTDFCC